MSLEEDMDGQEEEQFFDEEDPIEWVHDPGLGKSIPVERDSFFAAEIAEFHRTACSGHEFQIMRVQIRNGSVAVREACAKCGDTRGQAKAQTDKAWVASLPLLSLETSSDYQKSRESLRRDTLLRIARHQYEERGKFTRSYQDYLSSEVWRERARHVMVRCGQVCEGCRGAGASEVHHLTYENFQNEFLFELVGLCEACHVRWHDSKDRRRRRARIQAGT